jgi:Protein of unknown function (DUF559)
VEVDGASHKHREAADERRDRALERLGYRVLRLPNECVETDIEAAVLRVRQALASLLVPTLSSEIRGPFSQTDVQRWDGGDGFNSAMGTKRNVGCSVGESLRGCSVS